jgi:hypothetical protein
MKQYLTELGGEELEGMDKDLRSNVYNHFLIGFMDRLFKKYDTKNFYAHFLRKDSTIINNDEIWNAIPRDYDETKDWTAPNASFYNERFGNQYELPETKMGLNPMFRFENKQMVPCVHCEIDGNNVSILLSLIIANLIGFAAIIAAIPLIPFPFNLFVFLLFLLLLILSALGDLGKADKPEFEFEDPEPLFDFDDAVYLSGDVVAAYGKWIMDTEHGQYFEIHPVKAYYVIGKLDSAFGVFNSLDQLKSIGATSITNADITEDLAGEICGLIKKNEKMELEPHITLPIAQALSYGLVTHYGRYISG